MEFRQDVRPEDVVQVNEILHSSKMFTRDEISTGVELVLERLLRGTSSGYHFLFLDHENMAIGFSCFGPIACTQDAFDLYWIAVRDDHRNSGRGSTLLEKTEEILHTMYARQIYVETSSSAAYAPTRAFYERRGYREGARLRDFYRPGDDKIVYVKSFSEEKD